MKKLYSNKLVIFSLILPGLLLFLLAILAPICLSVYYGFTDYSGMGQAEFIGWDNYVNLMSDETFHRALINSLLLAIGFIVIQHPIAIVVAAVLDKLQGKAEGFFRCVYFIPNVISVAVIAYLWKFIYNPDFGLLNNILKGLGYQGKINWFSADTAIWSVLIVLIWHGFGWGMLIYYAGIKNIDPVLYEAASIDGASSKQTFMRITLPL
ncbi:MAG: sugar ABC transporter permease, partial [Mobilitalea sp.]